MSRSDIASSYRGSYEVLLTLAPLRVTEDFDDFTER